MPQLTAPFPYFGGKSRWSDAVWERFGEAHTYLEPFAGSLAVLLGNPRPAPREIVCDTHSAICNFWRAVRADPEQVATYASNPTIHQDLTARHRWLVEYFTENHAKFEADPDYYDCKAAGWWCWGMSNWIGGNFCDYGSSAPDRVSFVHHTGSGQGVTDQREVRDDIPLVKPHGAGVNAQRDVYDKRPAVKPHDSGVGVQPQSVSSRQVPFVNGGGGDQGIQAQRDVHKKIPVIKDCGGSGINAQKLAHDKVPFVNGAGAGQGTQAQRALQAQIAQPDHYEFVLKRMTELADRLFRVIVLNRSWESALTNPMLGSKHRDRVCIFVDPPYILDERSASLYHTDASGQTDSVALDAYKWCVAHGDEFRIAYASHAGDFKVPRGWSVETQTMTGIRSSKGRDRDQIMFSPACIGDVRGSLF